MDVIIFSRGNGEVTVRNVPAGASDQDFQNAMQDAVNSGKAADIPEIVGDTTLPAGRNFRATWRRSGSAVSVDMPLARDIHAERMAVAQAAEIARLKVDERGERLKGNTTQADSHAATVTALEALDLNTLATQIGNAPNATALSAIWPANVPRS